MSVVTISEEAGTAELEDRPESGAAVLLLLGIEVATEEVDVEAALASTELEIATGEEPNTVEDADCEIVETKVEKIVEIVVVI